jgi:hypothetical protein
MVFRPAGVKTRAHEMVVASVTATVTIHPRSSAPTHLLMLRAELKAENEVLLLS